MIGIVIEANPFHNGHKYFIDRIKELYPNEKIIAVTSTSFTMRGEISVIDKFKKTNDLLKSGIDLVMELPLPLGNESSDKFAYNSISILTKLGVDKIICGCEDDNINNIESLYDIINSENFKNQLNKNLNLHLSYKETFTSTLNDLRIDYELIDLFNKPNFTLAYQYYSSLKKLKMDKVELILVKRAENENILSATKIKEMLLSNKDVAKYLPYNDELIDYKTAIDNFNRLTNYKIKFNQYTDDLNKDVINYLKKLDKIDINKSSNKVFTNSRIRRSVLRQLLEYSNIKETTYLRVLGMSNKGLMVIKNLNKEIKKYLFSSPKELVSDDVKELLNIELKATQLYEQLTNKDILIKEYQLPIKKE